VFVDEIRGQRLPIGGIQRLWRQGDQQAALLPLAAYGRRQRSGAVHKTGSSDRVLVG